MEQERGDGLPDGVRVVPGGPRHAELGAGGEAPGLGLDHSSQRVGVQIEASVPCQESGIGRGCPVERHGPIRRELRPLEDHGHHRPEASGDREDHRAPKRVEGPSGFGVGRIAGSDRSRRKSSVWM